MAPIGADRGALSSLRVAYERTGGALVAAATLLAIVAPTSTAWWFPLFGAAVTLAFPSGRNLVIPFIGVGAIVACFRLLALDLAMSAIWSADSVATLIATGVFVLYLCCAWLAQEGLGAESDGVIARLSAGMVIGVGVGSAFLLFEVLTGSLVQRVAFTYLPTIRPASPHHIGMLNGWVALLLPDDLNRSVGTLNLLIWPTLLILIAGGGLRGGQYVAIALGIVAAGVTIFSRHDASKVALIAACLTHLLGRVRPLWACRLVAAGWAIATLAVVPAAHLAYHANLHMSEWLPVNAQARVIIWGATAEQVSYRPLLGIGADSSKLLNELRPPEDRPGHVVRWGTGVHAHNVYLQTWYELGALGAVLLLATGLAVLLWIARLPAGAQSFALSTFVAGAVLAAFSWGMWQPWFLATCFLTSTLTVLALTSVGALARDERP